MDNFEDNSLSDHIIAFLCSARSTRIYYRILRERRFARYKKANIANTLSRLKKRNLIENESGAWKITQKGARYWSEKHLLDFIQSPFAKGAPKQTIIAFDIPETHRKERTWLRNQLKIFGYTMIQKSLWRGPGPLPKEFKDRVKKLKIDTGIKTFIIDPK